MIENSPGNFGNSRVPYDWYQTATHTIITVRIANLKEADVKVTIINDALDVMCSLMDGRQFRMHFNLYKNVVVEQSNWAVDTAKLVIHLKKIERKRWHSLECLPPKQGNKPKSFIGIVNIRDAKREVQSLLSATEFENKDANQNAITITQARSANADPNVPNEPISLDYNWYQNEEYINLVIHVPDITLPDNRNFLFYEDDINIILTDNMLNWICNFPTGVTNVNFKLYREISSNDSRYEISPCRTKIEIKLHKVDKAFWPAFVLDPASLTGGTVNDITENGEHGESQTADSNAEQKQDGPTTVVNNGGDSKSNVTEPTTNGFPQSGEGSIKGSTVTELITQTDATETPENVTE